MLLESDLFPPLRAFIPPEVPGPREKKGSEASDRCPTEPGVGEDGPDIPVLVSCLGLDDRWVWRFLLPSNQELG